MLASALFALAGAAVAAAQSTLSINTPSTPVFCQPTLFSWSGGTAPYYLTINEGGSTSSVLQSLLSNTDATSYTWIADIAAGTSITLAIKDSTGATNFAQAVTIGASPTGATSCGSASSQAASQSSAAAAASTVSDASTTAAESSSAAAVSSSSSAAATSSAVTSSAARSSSASSSAARSSSPASSAAGAASSVAGGASSIVGGASSAAASATGSGTSGAFATFGAPVLTTGLLAAGALAVALF